VSQPTAEPPLPLALIAASRRGAGLAARLGARWPAAEQHVLARYLPAASERAQPIEGPLREAVGPLFRRCRGLVFFLPVGAVARLIAPLLRDKRSDPAVVAVDESGRFAVAMLSAHAGGGNALAERVAAILGARPVVTSAAERLGLPAVELIGNPFGWQLEAGRQALLRVAARLVDGAPVALFQDGGSEAWLAQGSSFQRQASWKELLRLRPTAALVLVVTDREVQPECAAQWVVWRPRETVAGLGCSSGASAEELGALLRAALAEAGLAVSGLGRLATIDRKLAEPGLRALAGQLGLELVGFSAAELAAVEVPNPSELVRRTVGTPSVAEAAARLGAGGQALVLPKRASQMATVALARAARPVS
jgi:cobalamin biosynthesis protein CbiG